MAKGQGRSRADRRQVPEITPSTERRAPGPRDLAVRVETPSPDHVILRVENELVTPNYYLLVEALERLTPLNPGLRVEIDLSRVPYADSEALGRLNAWTRKLARAGASLVLVNPTPYVTSIIDLLHLDTVLAIVHRHAYPGD